jgi:membrane protein DedA with SNARE-associated domain
LLRECFYFHFFFNHRAAMGVLQLPVVAIVFIVAAILGDFVNFWIGSKVFFSQVFSRFLSFLGGGIDFKS